MSMVSRLSPVSAILLRWTLSVHAWASQQVIPHCISIRSSQDFVELGHLKSANVTRRTVSLHTCEGHRSHWLLCKTAQAGIRFQSRRS